ncbi:MAG: hypothetical protein F4110_09615 [Acidimicrobiaceae bacterium]|nr:hypothetical protein [Acidimicrobiaceae bacterium]MYE95781.1 hypothetical protein [Acidimicrobiaceae bacterium]MYH43959.1 hypothetical protein [Acidimicrobiaceae bacterium]MYI54220.1 hypothetical protein [Acidimicrobiaceae bacterium]MYJ84897.1 hypothetical protein [Acidimicrobiaceae bacterium]
MRWFRRNDVAAVADDTHIFEVFPGPNFHDALGAHCLHVVDMGMTQGQNWDLDALAAACAEAGRYEFLLQANPEPFVGGFGSPVKPSSPPLALGEGGPRLRRWPMTRGRGRRLRS